MMMTTNMTGASTTSLHDLPTEILLDIADLIQRSSASSSQETRSYPLSPSVNARELVACASLSRALRNVFRPLIWSRVTLSAGQRAGSSREGAPVTFPRALEAFYELLISNPEIAGYVREFGIYLPAGGGGRRSGFNSRGGDDDDEEGDSEVLEGDMGNSEDDEDDEHRVFPLIVRKLKHVWKLTLVSYLLRRNGNNRARKPSESRTTTTTTTTSATTTTTTTTGTTTGMRVDWDALSESLRMGLERMFMLENLSVVQVLGVVVPPRMLFGRTLSVIPSPGANPGVGAGAPGGGSTYSRPLNGLKKLVLVAHCPMSPKRLEQIDATAPVSLSSLSGDRPVGQVSVDPLSVGGHGSVGGQQPFQFGLGEGGSNSNVLHSISRASRTSNASTGYGQQPHEPRHPLASVSSHTRTIITTTTATPLTSLSLAYCDTAFLRYISRLYPCSFMTLTSLCLNVIERDLPYCQFFLDQATCPPELSGGCGGARGGGCLEEFDCTIRCNTAASYYGLFSLHALDFSKGSRSRGVAAAAAAAVVGGGGSAVGNVGSGLNEDDGSVGVRSTLKKLTLRYLLLSQVTEAVTRAIEVNVATALECCGSSGEGGGGGLEFIHLVVDWTLNGDEILLDGFRNVDRIVERRCRGMAWSSSPFDSPSSSLAFESTPSPRTPPPPPTLKSLTLEATHWPCMPNCGFRKEVLSVTSLSTSGAEVNNNNTGPYHDELQGDLDQFMPFLSSQAQDFGIDFQSRYILGHRRDGPFL